MAAKHALLGLTKALAVEWASDRIRVNAIFPGLVQTDLTQHYGERVFKSEAARTPLRRLATAKDIADAVAYLAGDEAAFLTGVTLPLTGRPGDGVRTAVDISEQVRSAARILGDRIRNGSVKEKYWSARKSAARWGTLLRRDNRDFALLVAGDHLRFLTRTVRPVASGRLARSATARD